MFNKRYIYSIILILFGPFFALTIEAGTLLNLDYSLEFEQHNNNEDDSLWSDLSFKLKDDYNSNSFNAVMDLTADLVYEHKRNVNNDLWRGVLLSNYKFNNAFSWLLNVELTELNTGSLGEFDDLNSQTVTNLSTGLEFKIINGIRGEFTSTLLATAYSYEDSPLDANESSFGVSYVYPFNISSNLTATILFVEQKYVDPDESINDVDNKQFRLEYDKQFSRVTFGLFVEKNEIEYLNQQLNNSLDAYGFSINYPINSRSILSFEVGNEIQQTYSINANLIDPQNPILTSGLVENERYSIQYHYTTNFNDLVLQAYQNDIQNISLIGSNLGLQEGFLLNYSHNINDKLFMEISYDQIKNEISDSESKLSTALLNYQINQSRQISTAISVIVEDGETDGVNANDAIVKFIFKANIF